MGNILHYQMSLEVWQALILWCFGSGSTCFFKWVCCRFGKEKKYFENGTLVTGQGLIAEFLAACLISPFALFVIWIGILVFFK